ncbi:MAG: NAD(P)-dependent oxidoreductase [Betaproteobacteria bacterium RIFCSPLOWO2_12_FULL_65_110]|nr:MAG: NAD(P)-dependent oxidoreductase [Betaproteobacteria bacterium RIFCSPLOWO2_02_FULL_65_20]OGA41706.1 MAG: NAD(P)-dependent oxidoreductase [Betaproteobacteria bacterium RIFCSPLOWO2_12_FULL_65_110]
MERKRLLVIGCGDVARRALPHWLGRYEVAALARAPDPALAASGVRLVVGDLDQPGTLAPLAGAAELIVHAAPPPQTGTQDVRTRNLLASLAQAQKGGAMLPQRVVYISTSGVYGDCGGDAVDESRPVHAQTDRARRRVDAETVLSGWCGERGIALVILRVPGIYAADRLPLAQLERGAPVLADEDDVYTNHIHADDLAAILTAGLSSGEGVYNASDDSEMKMGEYFDLVADRMGLPRPPRVRRAEAAGRISPVLLSFMSESRRLVNRRMKDGLGIRLRYPTVHEGVPQAAAQPG